MKWVPAMEALSITAAHARIAELEAIVERRGDLLREAVEDIESWGAYASDYFQEKHDLTGCLAAYRAELSGPKKEGE